MTDVHAERGIDRQPEHAMALFDGPIAGWLPVMVGPDEGTWRAETREGPVRVHLSVHVGDVWVPPAGAHHRRLDVEPDRTDFHNMLVAGLTPRIEGELRLEADADQSPRLVFDGHTRRRSRLTIALERFLVGDPLVRSGIDTLLDIIAERLATTPLDPARQGPRHGPVRLPIPR